MSLVCAVPSLVSYLYNPDPGETARPSTDVRWVTVSRERQDRERDGAMVGRARIRQQTVRVVRSLPDPFASFHPEHFRQRRFHFNLPFDPSAPVITRLLPDRSFTWVSLKAL